MGELSNNDRGMRERSVGDGGGGRVMPPVAVAREAEDRRGERRGLDGQSSAMAEVEREMRRDFERWRLE